jgi:hypothetical protein
MALNQILPFVTSAVMFVFAAWVLWRYARRRWTPMLLWGIGLAMFAVASFSEAMLTVRFDELFFRLWYLFGAVLTAAWIGQGTVFLLARNRWANLSFAALALASLVALAIVFATPLDGSHYDPAKPLSEQYSTREVKPGDPLPAGTQTAEIETQGRKITVVPGIVPLGAPLRLTTPIFNIYGTLTLVGGALYSTWQFWRKRQTGNRMVGNILIAAGALSIASASTLTRFGLGGYLFLGEFLAAVIMFAGFVVSTRRDVPAAPDGERPQAA